MNILKSHRLGWDVTEASLDDENVILDGHPLTPADLDLLNQPVELKTPNLVLYMLPMEYGEVERIEFPTGLIVTPLQILGAIYTYYSMPITNEELDRLNALDYVAGDEMLEALLTHMRDEINRGIILPRSELMHDETGFIGLEENLNGSFTVELG